MAYVVEYVLVTLHSAGVSRQYTSPSKLAHLRNTSIIPTVTIRVRHGQLKTYAAGVY